MKASLVFGDGVVEVELPDDTVVVRESGGVPLEPVADLDAAVEAALAAPVGSPRLVELARGARRVVVAFDDPTVPCFAPVWASAIGAVLRELASAGVGAERVELLCANALHRQPTHAELGAILGPELVAAHGERLRCHDAEAPGALVSLGRTASGHEVELSRAVVDADLTVYVNASCHRGFSGGWKSICVGLSGWRSIRGHHTPELMSMSLERNPLHEVLDEMGALVVQRLGPHRFFKIETLLANPMQVARVWAGSVDATREAALALQRAHLGSRRALLDQKADVVIYGVPDWSPYAAFSVCNPLLTLLSTGLGYLGGVIPALGKPGCSAILATPCPERWDEQAHPSYREVWERVLPTCGRDPHRALRAHAPSLAMRREYIDAYRFGHGFHPVHPLLGLFPLTRLRHAVEIVVAGIGDPSLARHAGLEAAPSVEEALERARVRQGPHPRVALVQYPPAMNRQAWG